MWCGKRAGVAVFSRRVFRCLRPPVAVFPLILATLVLLLVGAFISYNYQDDNWAPTPTNYSFTVDTLPRDQSEKQVADMLQQIAAKHGTNIYRLLDPLRMENSQAGDKPVGYRYIFTGNPAETTAGGEDQQVPLFFPDGTLIERPYRGSTKDLQLLHQNLIGTYTLTASADPATSRPLFEDLAQAGFIDETLSAVAFDNTPLVPGPEYMFNAERSFYSPQLILLALLTLLAATATVSSSRHRLPALQITYGQQPSSAYTKNLLTLLSAYVITNLVGISIITLWLWHYNQLAGYWPFTLLVLEILGFGLVVMLATHLLAEVMLARQPLGQTLKGRQPLRLLAVITATAQMLILIMMLPYLNRITSITEPVLQSVEAIEKWQQEPNLYMPVLDIPADFKQHSQTVSSYGKLGAEMDSGGKLVLVGTPPLINTIFPIFYSYRADSAGSNALIVNNSYLMRNSVYDISGRKLESLPEKENTIYLLLPEKAKDQLSEIEASWQRWATEQKNDRLAAQAIAAGKQPPDTEKEQSRFNTEILQIKNGQRVSTYDAAASSGGPFRSDPLLVVLSPLSGLAGSQYTISSGFFVDRVALETSLKEQGLDGRLKGVISLHGSAHSSLLENWDRISEQLRYTAAAFIAILLVAVVMATIYLKKNRRRIFVQRTHGHRFLRVHGGHLLLASALATAAYVYMTGVQLSQGVGLLLENQALAFPGSDQNPEKQILTWFFDPLTTLVYILLILVMLLSAILTIMVRQRRLTAQDLREA